jgi:hypothetical protein
LRPNGVLAIWSTFASHALTARLREADLETRLMHVRANRHRTAGTRSGWDGARSPEAGRVGTRPGCSVPLSLSPEEGNAGAADRQARRTRFIHRAVGGLAARAAERRRPRGHLPRSCRRAAVALRLRFSEMSKRHV